MNSTDFNQTLSSWVTNVIMFKKDGLKNDPLERVRSERYLQSKETNARKLLDNGSIDLEANQCTENSNAEKEVEDKNSETLERIYIESLIAPALIQNKAMIDSGLEKLESSVKALDSAANKNINKDHFEKEVQDLDDQEAPKRTGIPKAHVLKFKNALEDLKETYSTFRSQAINLLAEEKSKLAAGMTDQLKIVMKKFLSSRKKIAIEEVQKAHTMRIKERKNQTKGNENLISQSGEEEESQEPKIAKQIKKESSKAAATSMKLELPRDRPKRALVQQRVSMNQAPAKEKLHAQLHGERILEKPKVQLKKSKENEERPKNRQKAHQKNEDTKSLGTKKNMAELETKSFNFFIRGDEPAALLGPEIVRDLIRVVSEIEDKQRESNQLSTTLNWSVIDMETELLQRHTRATSEKTLKDSGDSNISEHSGLNLSTSSNNRNERGEYNKTATQNKAMNVSTSVDTQMEPRLQLSKLAMEQAMGMQGNSGSNYFDLLRSFHPEAAFYPKLADSMLEARMNPEAMYRTTANPMSVFDLFGMYEIPAGRMNPMNQARNASQLQYF